MDARVAKSALAIHEIAATEQQSLTSASCLAIAISWMGYLLLLASASAMSLQDMPNHLARAQVTADLLLHHAQVFGSDFQWHFMAVPYVLGDLLMTASVELLGAQDGAFLWTAVVLIAFAAALVFYLRSIGMRLQGQLLALLIAPYLATDWFFLQGFLEFRFALACFFVTVGLVARFRNQQTRVLYVAYAVALVLGYLTHLATPVFACFAIGISGLWRLKNKCTSWKIESALAAPLALVFIWHFVAVPHLYLIDPPAELFDWGTLTRKLAELPVEFERFSNRTDMLLFTLLAMSLVVGIRLRGLGRAVRTFGVVESLLLSVGFLCLYFVMPIGYRDAWFVNLRALAPAAAFLVVAMLQLMEVDPAETNLLRSAGPLALGLLLSGLNLIYLARHFQADTRWAQSYRSIVALIPQHARVFIISTRHFREGLGHAGAYATIDRDAIVNGLFSGDAGDPMKYFRYKHAPYTPEEAWYRHGTAIDWRRVGCEYNYVLASQPFDTHRIGVPVSSITTNSSAVLLTIDPQACRRETH